MRGVAGQKQHPVRGSKGYPGAGGQVAQFQPTDSYPNEPQSWMANGCSHAAHLPVLAFKQFQTNPAGRHGLAEADGRGTRGHVRLWVENPGAAGQRQSFLDLEPCTELEQALRRGEPLDLRPVFAFMSMARMQQLLVKCGFIAEQEQAFRVGIQAANRINIPGEAELGQSAIGGTIRREAGKDAAGFVEGEKHNEV